MATKKLHVRNEEENFDRGSELKKRRKCMEVRDSKIVHDALRGPYEIINLTEDDPTDEVQYLGTVEPYYGPATDEPRTKDELFCKNCGYEGHSTDQCRSESVGDSGITTDLGTEYQQSAGQSTAEQLRSMEEHMLDDLQSYVPTSPPESEPINSDGDEGSETNYLYAVPGDSSTYSEITCDYEVEDDDDTNMEWEDSISGESYSFVKNENDYYVGNDLSDVIKSLNFCNIHSSSTSSTSSEIKKEGIRKQESEVWLADTGTAHFRCKERWMRKKTGKRWGLKLTMRLRRGLCMVELVIMSWE